MGNTLDHLLDPSSMRLAMGDLTPQEVELAHTAIRRTLELLELNYKWRLVPKEPEPSLLMSIAVRLDHGLGVPGYYDQFAALGLDIQTPTHDQMLARALDVARKTHDALVALPFASHVAPHIEPLQQEISANLAAGDAAAAGVVRSAVRYTLTRPGLAPIPLDPSAQVIDAIAAALETTSKENDSAPASVPVEKMRALWRTDASRIHEEVVGLGFHQHQPTIKSSRPSP